MTAQTRALLKTWFETNDLPTQAQFIDFLDSYVSILDDLSTSGTILFAAVTAQVADLKTLNSAPFELIATPGPGKFIRPISIDMRMVFAGVAYVNNLNPKIQIATANDPLFDPPNNWLGNAASSFVSAQPTLGVAAQNQYVVNQALEFFNVAGDSINGTSLAEFFILYQLVSA